MRLSPVLANADLSPAELQASRLDGEVYALAGAYCLVDELEAPRHRARAVLAGRSTRLIAELGTAAWVWGAALSPQRLEFAVSPDARVRGNPAEPVTIREIVHVAGDVTHLDGLPVTTPLRTIIDLARRGDSDESADSVEPDVVVVARLAAIAGLSLADCLVDLEGRVGIPSKKRARQTLTTALGQ